MKIHHPELSGKNDAGWGREPQDYKKGRDGIKPPDGYALHEA